MLQHQGRGDPTGKPDTLIRSTNLQQCPFGDSEERYHQPIDRSGLTPASRLQRSVGQRQSRTPSFLLTDAAHGKHVGRKTNSVGSKTIKQHKSKDLKKYTKNKLNERNTRCKSKYVNKIEVFSVEKLNSNNVHLLNWSVVLTGKEEKGN
ncbi:hypothetical protein TNCV_4411751 [Trichonephila clavipes]|nr:hypothetical protein TNCV_4411751 [Trichonephila clavipes]